MDACFKEPIAAATSKGREILISKLVNDGSLMSPEKVLLITEIGLLFYKKSAKKTSNKYYWQDLKKIEVEDNKATFYIPSKVTILSNELKPILKAATFAIRRALENSEINKVEKKGIVIGTHVNSPLFSFSRISNYLRLSRAKILPESLATIEEVMRKRATKFNLNNLKDLEKISEILLEILPHFQDLHTIAANEVGKFDPFIFAAKLVEKNTKIRNFVFFKSNSKNLKVFLTAVSKLQKPKISGLYFDDIFFAPEDTALLKSVVVKQEIISLGFPHMNQRCGKSVIGLDFFSPNVLRTLTVLQLDGSVNLNIPAIFKYTPSIGVLSLANCRLELSDVFEQMQKAPVLKLNTINVSGNYFKKVPLVTRILSSLTKIIASDVKWSLEPMEWLLSHFVTNASLNVSLDISKAAMSFSEWKELMLFLKENTAKKLLALDWSENPIEKPIFTFILSSEVVETVLMDYCFHYQSQVPIRLFARFIKCCRTLRRLSVKGKEEGSFRELSSLIFDAMAHSYLEEIDMPQTLAGPEGLRALSEMIMSMPRLKKLGIDGLGTSDEIALLEFSGSIAGCSAVVECPTKDIEPLPEEKKQLIRKSFYFVPKGEELTHHDGPFIQFMRGDMKLFFMYHSKKETREIQTKSRSLFFPESYEIKLQNEETITMDTDGTEISMFTDVPLPDPEEVPKNDVMDFTKRKTLTRNHSSVSSYSRFNSPHSTGVHSPAPKMRTMSSTSTPQSTQTKTQISPISLNSTEMSGNIPTPSPLKSRSVHSSSSNKILVGELQNMSPQMKSSTDLLTRNSRREASTPKINDKKTSVRWNFPKESDEKLDSMDMWNKYNKEYSSHHSYNKANEREKHAKSQHYH